MDFAEAAGDPRDSKKRKEEYEMKKKLLALVLVVVLGITSVVGGTMAYLTDTDDAVNVMTLGNVYIEQIEQERGADGALVDFSQNKPAYPAVGDTAWAETGVTVNGTEYKVFSDGLKNVVDKIVTVKNTGKTSAYVRTIIAIEAPEGDPNNLIHVNVNGTGLSHTSWVKTEINGEDYVISCFTYDEALDAGEISAPSLMQVFLDKKTTNEDCAAFGDTWEILAFSQAVQAEGFDNAATALNEAFGEITAENHPWEDGVVIPTYATNAAELAAALAKGGNVIVTEDITADEMIVVKKDTVLEVAEGATLSTTAGYMLYVDNGANLTIKDGAFKNNNGDPTDTAIIAAVGNANVVIEDGSFEGGNRANSVDAVVWAYAGNPTVTIKGGTFTTGADASGCAGTILYVEKGTIYVEGGSFTNSGNDYWGKNWMMNLADAAYRDGTAKIVITGGSFNFDLTTKSADGNHVAPGYIVTESNGIWTFGDTKAATADELTEALAAGKAVTLSNDVETTDPLVVNGGTLNGGTLNGGGNTLDSDYAGTSAWGQYALVANSGTVENITVVDAFRGIGSANTSGDVYIKNVKIDNVTYAINGNGTGTQNVYVSDSTIYGWNSYADIASINFTDCTLGKGNSYDGYMVIYGTTNFTNCVFEDGYSMCGDLRGDLDSTVTFTNCTYNGTKVTADNFKTLFMEEGDEIDFNKLSDYKIVIDGVQVTF